MVVGDPRFAQRRPVERRVRARARGAGHPPPEAAEVGPGLGLAVVQLQGPAEGLFRRNELTRSAERYAKFPPALGKILLDRERGAQLRDRRLVVGGLAERDPQLVAGLDVARITVDGPLEELDDLAGAGCLARGGEQFVRLGLEEPGPYCHMSRASGMDPGCVSHAAGYGTIEG